MNSTQNYMAGQETFDSVVGKAADLIAQLHIPGLAVGVIARYENFATQKRREIQDKLRLVSPLHWYRHFRGLRRRSGRRHDIELEIGAAANADAGCVGSAF
jgi:hypothetical protein